MTEAQMAKKFEVKQTNDYGQFKYLFGNRSVNKNHVQELIKSFQENPQLAELRPILVNEKMEIVDGQHNLQAAEALHRPVFYVVVPGLKLETAQLLNAYQRPWTLVDYANSFAISGNKDYSTILQVVEEYGMPMTVASIYLAGGQTKGAGKRFKLGDFSVVDEAAARKKLDMLSDFAEFGSWWSSRAFALAFWVVVKFDGYDHQRMIEGARRSGAPIRQATRIDYLRELERAYNYGRPASKDRFF